MVIIKNENTLLNDLELYISSFFIGKIFFHIFYGKLILKRNAKVAVFEILEKGNIILFNEIFNKEELEVFFLKLNLFFLEKKISLVYINSIQYFCGYKYMGLSKIEKFELDRKFYNKDYDYFLNKNILLNKLLELKRVKYFLENEGFCGLKETLYRTLDYKKEHKFLFINYSGYLNHKKYIIRGCFNRLLDVINNFDGYLLFKYCDLNVPKEYFYVEKKYSIYNYYFTVFSFINGNVCTLSDLYNKKEIILMELFKLSNKFFIKKSCNELNINQSLNTISLECINISHFSSEIYYTYGYFSLDMHHIMYYDDTIIINNYNCINYSPFILIYLYILIFLISVDYSYINKNNIANNIVTLNKFYGKYIIHDLLVINKNELSDILNSIIVGIELDLGINVNNDKVKFNLIKNKALIIKELYNNIVIND